jgi:hypothetical protein
LRYHPDAIPELSCPISNDVNGPKLSGTLIGNESIDFRSNFPLFKNIRFDDALLPCITI